MRVLVWYTIPLILSGMDYHFNGFADARDMFILMSLSFIAGFMTRYRWSKP